MYHTRPLFVDYPIEEFKSKARKSVKAYMEKFNAETFPRSTADQHATAAFNLNQLGSLIIHFDKKTVKYDKDDQNIIELKIPLEGSHGLLEITPSNYSISTTGPIGGSFNSKALFLYYAKADAESLKREIAKDEEILRKNIEALNKEVSEFNVELLEYAKAEARSRQAILAEGDDLLSQLGIPRGQ